LIEGLDCNGLILTRSCGRCQHTQTVWLRCGYTSCEKHPGIVLRNKLKLQSGCAITSALNLAGRWVNKQQLRLDKHFLPCDGEVNISKPALLAVNNIVQQRDILQKENTVVVGIELLSLEGGRLTQVI
jgi:hypothetical protein